DSAGITLVRDGAPHPVSDQCTGDTEDDGDDHPVLLLTWQHQARKDSDYCTENNGSDDLSHDSPSHMSCMRAAEKSPPSRTITTVTGNSRLLSKLLSEMQPEIHGRQMRPTHSTLHVATHQQ